MENKNVVVVKHHSRPITLANSFYTTQCPDIADRIVINLTSRNPDRAFAQQVSPFYVGPVTGPDGASSDSLEIFWQVGKVFLITMMVVSPAKLTSSIVITCIVKKWERSPNP